MNNTIFYFIPVSFIALILIGAAIYAYYYYIVVAADDDERKSKKQHNAISLKFTGNKTLTIDNPNFVLEKFWLKTTHDFRIIFLQGNSLYSYILGGVSEGKFVYVYADRDKRQYKTKSRIAINDGVWHLIEIRHGVSIYIDGEHVNEDMIVSDVNYRAYFIDKPLYLGGIDEKKFIGKIKFSDDTKPELQIIRRKIIDDNK